MTTNEPGVAGFATHHDEPMLFPSRTEAAAYCEDGEEPVALIHLSDYEALQAELDVLVEALEYISKKSKDALKMTDNRAGRAKDEIMCGYAEHIIQMCDAALAAMQEAKL